MIRKMPAVSDATVFNPDLGIPRGEGEIDVGILGENGGMRFDFALFDLPLVCNQVLQGEGRGDQFTAGAVMVEFAAFERQDSERDPISGSGREGSSPRASPKSLYRS